MGFYDGPGRGELENVRPGVLHLLRNHATGVGMPTALLEVADAYLRMNPDDAEVRAARDRLEGPGR